jgi:hypothetical protein
MSGEVVVKTQPELRCQNRHKKFKDSHCLLTISVGQTAHEYLKFSATISLINQSFKQCTICVGDALQRYTLAMEMAIPPEDLFDVATQLGDEWVQRNFCRYSLLNMPYEIIRWGSYLIHPDFNLVKEKILTLHSSDLDCQKAFSSAIDLFMERYLRKHCRGLPVTNEIVRNYCFEYLLEESVAMCLWAENKYDYDVYPGRRNPAMEFIHSKFIQPVTPNVLTSVVIKAVNLMY